MNGDATYEPGRGDGGGSLPVADRFVPVGHRIADHLRRAILAEELPPGAHIRQAPVAAEFGTSRIPVREALTLLETEGLVILTPNSGAKVARFDFGEHVELYRIREQLEPLAIAESTPRLSDAAIADLARRAARIVESDGEPGAYLAADRDFHLSSYAAAPMPQLLELIDSLWNQTTHYRRAYLRLIHGPDREIDLGFDEHRLLVDALGRRDPEAAAELVRMHLRRTRIRITEHADELNDPGRPF